MYATVPMCLKRDIMHFIFSLYNRFFGFMENIAVKGVQYTYKICRKMHHCNRPILLILFSSGEYIVRILCTFPGQL